MTADANKYVRGEGKAATLAVLLGAPLTDRHFERLGIPYLSQLSDVVIIDCMRLVGRNPEHVTSHPVDWPLYATASSREELREIIAHYSPLYAFDDIGMSPETAFVGETVQESGTKLICVRQGRLPQPSHLQRLKLLLKGRSSGLTAKTEAIEGQELPTTAVSGLVGKLVGRLADEYNRRFRLPSPDLALLAGTRALDWYAKRAAERIWIGSDDYHTFRREREEQSAFPKPFAVFVDVCLPLATDWQLLGIAPPITADEYYPMLRAVFDRVEQQTGLPVVVAGHPNSRTVPDYGDLVGGRTIIFGQSSRLVRESSFVLSHASTASSFVALSEKPAIFLTSKCIDRTSYGAHVRSLARSLNGPLLMLERGATLSYEVLTRPADVAACRRYVDQYLRAPWADEQGPWQAFNEFLAGKLPASVGR